MGFEGLQELGKFVQEGGALIAEGSTSALMAEYNLGGGVIVEHPAQLFARGSILRGTFADLKSPIAYGFDGKDLPVYFNQDPVLNATVAVGGFGGGGGGGRGGGITGVGQNVTPNAVPIHVSPLEPGDASQPAPAEQPAGRGGRGGGGGRGGFGAAASEERPRVVVQFPANANDMLLSGTLSGGEALANRALAVDVQMGKGHIVMFALRPFWRWQSQGTYFLAFNAILNWDHLDAGKPDPARRPATEGAGPQ
jgi:hypothetical protein